MSTDVFRLDPDDPDNPARGTFGVTPHDVNELPLIPKALYFNATGWVTVRSIDASADEAFYVTSGQTLDVRAKYVRATGTSLTIETGAPSGAHSIVALS